MFQLINSWIVNIIQRYSIQSYRILFFCLIIFGSIVMFILTTIQFQSKSNINSMDNLSEMLIDFDEIKIDQNLLLRRRMLFYTHKSRINQNKRKWKENLHKFLLKHSPFYQNKSICNDYWIVTFRFVDILLDTAYRLPNWCIVIVMEGDDYIGIVPSNIFRLTGMIQQELAEISGFYKESLLLPKGLYTVQKNLGYLWAIFHQAMIIWDFDNINEILINQTVLPFPLNGTFNAWTIINYLKPLFNPYTCFSSNFINLWPRGYPFRLFGDLSQDDPSCQISSVQWSTKNLGLIHSLIEGYCDANTGYEFVKPNLPLHLKISVNNSNNSHELFIVPRHAFSPYDQQTTFHLQSTLWALYLPVTIEQQASDTFRSYIMQRLMWDVDLQIAFTGTFLFKRYTSAEAIATSLLFRKSNTARMSEKFFYRTIHNLIQFLIHWSSNDKTLPKRLEQMFAALYQHKHIKSYDLYLIQLWLQDLSYCDYNFPTIVV